MNIPGWIPYIQGLKTTLTGAAAALTQRATIKFVGLPVFDDGTQTVVGGVQIITGSGTWDGKSGRIHVKGSGARTIALPDPDSTLQYEGLQLAIVDAAANSDTNNITVDPAGSGAINGNATRKLDIKGASMRLEWISAGVWVGDKGALLNT